MDVPIIHVCFGHRWHGIGIDWLYMEYDGCSRQSTHLKFGVSKCDCLTPMLVRCLGFIIRTTSNQLTQNSPKTTWQRIKGNNLNLNVNAMNHVDLWWFMCFYIKDKSYVQSNDLWKELPWIFPEPGDTNLKRVTYLVLDEAPHSFTRREVRSFGGFGDVILIHRLKWVALWLL